MCSTIAPQLGCIFLVILLAYSKSIENPLTSNFLAVVFFHNFTSYRKEREK